MGKIEDLAAEYERLIASPWQRTGAGAQRVIMVVYEKELERALRARVAEFEQRTLAAGHRWIQYDCTRSFAEWMAAHEYREQYFQAPDVLEPLLQGEFLPRVVGPLQRMVQEADEDTVVAVRGVASLYGFVRVSEVIAKVEPDIQGRLVVFYPGSRDGTTYRLLDARDGWNYLATCITLHGAGGRA